MPVIMGLDVGDVRIGVAFSDPLLFGAHAYGSIERKSDEEAIRRIAELVEERKVERIVVGLPLTLKGRVGEQGEKVREFIRMLREKVDVPIIEWDERLTTAAAERILREMGVPGRKRRKVIDQVAATLILQSYLDMLRNRGDGDVE
ncbi:Holliday junction resolvase RuvX [Candidatus Poribacteria bacterium]|nr:MAG: Holliday junction resolvase RuvX [Candidatus Poribacteria bacterium]